MAGKEKVGPVLAAASAAWIKTLPPRPSEIEACAWMRAVFNGRHLCRAQVCPRVCPRSPDHGAEAPPPAWSSPAPEPLSPEDHLRAEAAFASVRLALGLGAVTESFTIPRLEVAVPELDDAPPDDDSGPQCLMCGDDESACAWCDKPAVSDHVGNAPRSGLGQVSRDLDPDRHRISDHAEPKTIGYPPCSGCGQIRPIMLVMAAAGGQPAGTICSRCYRWRDV